MKTSSHARWQRVVERLVTQPPGDHGLAAVHAHLRHCHACTELYNRLQQSERALCAPGDQATVFEMERVGALVLERCLPSDPRARWYARVRRGSLGMLRAPALGLVSVVILAIAAVALVPWLNEKRGTNSNGATGAPGELTARGSDVTDSGVGVRVLRLSARSHAVAPLDVGGRLARNDVVTFTYTSESAAEAKRRGNFNPLASLLVATVDSQGTLRWVVRQEGSDQSLALAPGQVDEPLSVSAAVDAYAAGPLFIVAVFSRQALSASDLGPVLRAAVAQTSPLGERTISQRPSREELEQATARAVLQALVQQGMRAEDFSVQVEAAWMEE